MYGIFTYIWVVLMVNVGKYTIHWVFGYVWFYPVVGSDLQISCEAYHGHRRWWVRAALEGAFLGGHRTRHLLRMERGNCSTSVQTSTRGSSQDGYVVNRRKFRSLTSDNMDSWKSSAARKKINRCGKKEDQQARNVREVAKCCVFQWFVGRLGRKVTSLKRRVRRWPFSSEMKNCTPL